MSSGNSSTSHDLAIVGGGFSGICAATMAAQMNPALSVTLFDDSEQLGLGIAYATNDPDHRLNGPAVVHSMVPSDLMHLMRWCHQNEIVDEDPDSVTRYGLFIRRSDYARYMQALLPAHVKHCRERVDTVTPDEANYWHLSTNQGTTHTAKAVLLAVGNPAQSVPEPMRSLADHPAVTTNPWDRSAIAAIDSDAAVLIVGSSLTAADQICSLIGQGHRGPIQAISRNGLRPTHWPLPAKNAELPDIEAVINDPPEQWITDALNTTSPVRNLTRAVRRQIQTLKDSNEPWEPGFDEVRNKVWQIWPKLSVSDKQRFLKRLRPFYDIYRFRIPPQTAETLAAAEATDQLQFRTASLQNIEAPDDHVQVTLNSRGTITKERFDHVINCTGFDLTAEPLAGSLCNSLLKRGHLSRDPCGIGYQTDQVARCIGRDGSWQSGLRMVGPQTAGSWGDPLSAVFIGFQIRRMMPDLIDSIART